MPLPRTAISNYEAVSLTISAKATSVFRIKKFEADDKAALSSLAKPIIALRTAAIVPSFSFVAIVLRITPAKGSRAGWLAGLVWARFARI
jgi:hypothetical protein